MSRGIEKQPRSTLHTRAGSPARILIQSGPESPEIIGAYWGQTDKWIPVTWDKDGFYLGKDKPCALDLMLVPDEKEAA